MMDGVIFVNLIRKSETTLRKAGGIGWRRWEAISMVHRAGLVEEKLQMQLSLIAHQVNSGIFFPLNLEVEGSLYSNKAFLHFSVKSMVKSCLQLTGMLRLD